MPAQSRASQSRGLAVVVDTSDSDTTPPTADGAAADAENQPSEEKTCSICLEGIDLNTSDQHSLKQCGHLFHASCLLQWTLTANNGTTCPECRSTPDRPLGHFTARARASYLRRTVARRPKSWGRPAGWPSAGDRVEQTWRWLIDVMRLARRSSTYHDHDPRPVHCD